MPGPRGGASFGLILFCLLVAITGGGVGMWFWAGRESRPPVTATDQPPATRPTAATGGRPKPPPATEYSRPTPPPDFDAALVTARELSAEYDKTEPAETAAGLKRLTGEELALAQRAISAPRLLSDNGGRMIDMGLVGWATRQSRRIALADQNFTGVARKLWRPETGPKGIVSMANSWGLYDPTARAKIVGAVRDDAPAAALDPDVRDSIERWHPGWFAR